MISVMHGSYPTLNLWRVRGTQKGDQAAVGDFLCNKWSQLAQTLQL